jgi:hypothetical protein
MLNARYRVTLLWQRLVAALSLVMAAALAPGAVAATAGGGAGAIGSRASSGAQVASAAGALAGHVAALIEGQQQSAPLDSPADGAKAKVCTAATPHASMPPEARAVHPQQPAGGVLPAYAARSGESRAPPAA